MTTENTPTVSFPGRLLPLYYIPLVPVQYHDLYRQTGIARLFEASSHENIEFAFAICDPTDFTTSHRFNYLGGLTSLRVVCSGPSRSLILGPPSNTLTTIPADPSVPLPPNGHTALYRPTGSLRAWRMGCFLNTFSKGSLALVRGLA